MFLLYPAKAGRSTAKSFYGGGFSKYKIAYINRKERREHGKADETLKMIPVVVLTESTEEQDVIVLDIERIAKREVESRK